MPYVNTIQGRAAMGPSEQQDMIREFDSLRRELDEMRAAFMSLRALLVAGTAVGAGYNTAPTDLGTTTPNAAAVAPRFTRI